MEETSKDPVSLSKGINLGDLMNDFSEFHIDTDFKKKPTGMLLNADDDLFPEIGDEEDSDDGEDVLKNIEESTDKAMLSSPEYHSFDVLATKMVDCIPSGDVKMLIIEEGNGPLVPVDAEVTIHYAAYWEKASIPFDSTLTMNSGAPLKVRLGIGRVLPGLEIGLTAVRGPAARVTLLLQPNATWGALGVRPRLQPVPALFVVVLYAVRDVQAAVRFNDLPTQEQCKFEVTMRTVTSIHFQAKELFTKKKYLKAIKNYQQSIYVLKLSQPEKEVEENEIKNMKIKAYLNLAMCYYKIDKPKYVIRTLDSLDYVTDVDKNCKALFYYGRANEQLGKIDDALKYYQRALRLEPKNNDIGKAMDDMDKYLKKSAAQERDMWLTAFKTEKKDLIDVDEDFQSTVKNMLEDMAKSKEYAKFDLPPSLTTKEVDFVKALAESYEGIVVLEDGEGKRKRFTIVRKLL